MPDTSIIVTITDRYSDSLKKMSSTTKFFSKDVDGLEDRLTHLTKNKAELKLELSRAKEQLKDAENRFKSTGNEVDRLTYLFANVQVDNITRNLKAVTSAAKETETEISKLDNRVQSTGRSAGGLGGSSNILSGFATSGLVDMAKDLFGNLGNSYVSSAYGDDGSTMFSSVLSGMAAGAAIGHFIPIPGVGAAIGAAS